jgi:hypothetical protein
MIASLYRASSRNKIWAIQTSKSYFIFFYATRQASKSCFFLNTESGYIQTNDVRCSQILSIPFFIQRAALNPQARPCLDPFLCCFAKFDMAHNTVLFLMLNHLASVLPHRMPFSNLPHTHCPWNLSSPVSSAVRTPMFYNSSFRVCCKREKRERERERERENIERGQEMRLKDAWYSTIRTPEEIFLE